MRGKRLQDYFVKDVCACHQMSTPSSVLLLARCIRGRLHIKGRIFPGISDVTTSLEWISLQNRFDEEWLDTGLSAIAGPDNSILLGSNDDAADLQKFG